MTKKAKNKNKHLHGNKQKSKSDLADREKNRKSGKQDKSSKKDLGIPFKDRSGQHQQDVKNLAEQKGQEKLKRRQAFKLMQQEARAKAVENQRTRVSAPQRPIHTNKCFYQILTPRNCQ
jgi:hypothetical protein